MGGPICSAESVHAVSSKESIFQCTLIQNHETVLGGRFFFFNGKELWEECYRLSKGEEEKNI